MGLSVSTLTVPLFEHVVLTNTSGKWTVLKVSTGIIGLSSQETGVDVSDDLLFSDGRRADSFPRNNFSSIFLF